MKHDCINMFYTYIVLRLYYIALLHELCNWYIVDLITIKRGTTSSDMMLYTFPVSTKLFTCPFKQFRSDINKHNILIEHAMFSISYTGISTFTIYCIHYHQVRTCIAICEICLAILLTYINNTSNSNSF